MSKKPGFLIYFSICFIGNIFCDNFSPINPAPYVPHKQYYLSGPTEKVDLVDATAKCLAMKMTLATVDDMQDQEILLDQLSEDYSKYGTFGPSEFWLVGPNGLNELKPVPRSAVPHPPGYTLLALPYSGSRKCVKLAFTPFNVQWVNDGCQGKHRFICTESTYAMRFGEYLALMADGAALHCAIVVIMGYFKAKLLETKAYTEEEVDKFLPKVNLADTYHLNTYNITDDNANFFCEETLKMDIPARPEAYDQFMDEKTKSELLHSLKKHSRGLSKRQREIIVSIYLTRIFRSTVFPRERIENEIKASIPKIEKDLHWSHEKVKTAIDLIVKILREEEEKGKNV